MSAQQFEAEMRSVRAELDERLEGVSESALREPGAEDKWSSADLMAHFAGYTRGVTDLLRAERDARSEAPPSNAPSGLDDGDFNAMSERS
jgi:hypothetical protein